MTITFLSDDRGIERGSGLRQTFSRQTEREMLLVTARSFVCQLVAALDGKQGWTASWKHDTGHGLLIVATPSRASEPCTFWIYVSCRLICLPWLSLFFFSDDWINFMINQISIGWKPTLFANNFYPSFIDSDKFSFFSKLVQNLQFEQFLKIHRDPNNLLTIVNRLPIKSTTMFKRIFPI